MEFTKMFLVVYPKFMNGGQLLDQLLDTFDSYETMSEASMALVPIHPAQLRYASYIMCLVRIFLSNWV
jgi:hypothetical protein